MNKRIKIAYVTTYDAKDKTKWSGTGYFIMNALEKHAGKVININVGNEKNRISIRLLTYLNKILYGRNYSVDRNEILLKKYAKKLEKELAKDNYDVIFSPGTIPVSFLDTNIPVFIWTDSNFASTNNYYYKLNSRSAKEGDYAERNALKRTRVAFYSSDWAKQIAKEKYKNELGESIVVPFGANFEIQKENFELRKISFPLKFLFVGVEWERKGGDIAFKTIAKLNEIGIESSLTVVGCIPPEKYSREFMEVIPFLNKNNENDLRKLDLLYKKAHFFLLPTRKECYGIVFCEANSTGLPVLTSDTGGVSTIVKSKENGILFKLEDGPEEYVKQILEIIKDGHYYETLQKNSFERYKKIFNWDVAGKAVSNKIKEEFSE